MSKKLVIVESPAKAKTISKFLGSEFTVLASYGHVRDLPKSEMGIDIEKNFEPQYIVSKEKYHAQAVKQIKEAYGKADDLYIATDEDREGEAIGWHILHILKIKDIKNTKRIVFHEITKTAILHALEAPRALDMNLVDAQQARRILDRLVGYELSPLLWKKIRYGLSAGRVQSVAVRLIVEKEEEIKAFNIEEYWEIHADFETKQKEKFRAQLLKIAGKPAKLENEKDATSLLKEIEAGNYTVTSLTSKDVKRSPAAPFTTSTLQQEASRKLGFSVSKTMQIAQQLYEGVNVGHGSEGLITYMRTDSFNLSGLAIAQAREVIGQDFGNDYLLSSPRVYKSKKGAQEAHEAIRPVNLHYRPDQISKHLDYDQNRLYELIWKRTIACQMTEAKLKQTSVDISSGDYLFRASGQVIEFPGFMKVYIEDSDQEDSEENTRLPAMAEKESLKLENVIPSQHFTKPPARYTEASLVKKMEELGIGRPSTYAPTISTIQDRGYIIKEKKQLIPTDTAFVVIKLLKQHFSNIVDYPFTAQMEEKLDNVAEGKEDWHAMLRDFYTPFHADIIGKDAEIKKSDVTSEEIDENCPECQKPLLKKLSRFGMFIACSGFPECKYSRPIEGQEASQERSLGKDPTTGEEIIATTGRYGPYVRRGEGKTAKMASIIAPYALATVTLEESLELFSLPRTLGEDGGEKILANNGRFGPYVQKAKDYRSIPKDKSVFTITLDEAMELLNTPKKPSRFANRWKKKGGEEKGAKAKKTTKKK